MRSSLYYSEVDVPHMRKWVKQYAKAMESPDILSDFERLLATELKRDSAHSVVTRKRRIKQHPTRARKNDVQFTIFISLTRVS